MGDGAAIILLFILIIAISPLLYYAYKIYNKLVRLRIYVDEQASNIQVHLKKKFDMLPALTNIVREYAKHEKGTLEEVTKLRSQWGASKSNDDKIKTANMLESAISKLLIVQERYPKLRANHNFVDIQEKINNVENELVDERKNYNDRVRSYNIILQEFPSNLIAKTFKFKEKLFFSIEG